MDEPKDQESTSAEELQDQTSPGKKAGTKKLVLFGIAGLVLVILVAVVTLLVTGDHQPHADSPVLDQEAASVPDSLALAAAESDDELDPEILEQIVENLEALTYVPDPSEIEKQTDNLSPEDSLNAMTWIEREKASLVMRKEVLDQREEELARREKEVAAKILRVEEVESERVTQLAKLYDGMESEAVAKLMANLDDHTVVAILPRMKAKNASEVLQLLPPRRAAKLSKQMISIAGT